MQSGSTLFVLCIIQDPNITYVWNTRVWKVVGFAQADMGMHASQVRRGTILLVRIHLLKNK